jgi:glycosyltransferase involved in cell wall biosynthesis
VPESLIANCPISGLSIIYSMPSKPFPEGYKQPIPEVSIVMPCLNEAETLQACIEGALMAIKSCGVRGEVVIADNGSTDDSPSIALQAGARLVRVKDKGYGNALLGGIQAAAGTYVLMGDADGSYDFGELPVFLERLRQGKDLVMGCRLPAGGGTIQPGAMPWKHRWFGNPVLSGLGKLFFRAPIDDFHCGLRAFRRDAILALDLRCAGMEFASEMVVRSTVARLKIAQVPITLRPDGRTRAPHLRSWRDGWRHLRFMLLYSPKWLFFVPGLFLFTAGTFGFLVLMPGPVRIGAVTFDTNTLLICSAIILIGFQVVFFAIYTKTFAVQTGLLRPDSRITWLLNTQPVEWGVGIGLILALLGMGYLVYSVLQWQEAGFGNLPYSESLRIVIPGVTAVALGVQCIFSGFALAVLGLERSSHNSDTFISNS